MPRTNGMLPDRARGRDGARTRSSSIIARIWSSLSNARVLISCEVRNPSKKCRNGTRDSSVAAWAISALSCASCTEPEHSSAKPEARTAITSLWSPKIDSACVASDREATWNTVGVSSPAILYMLGSISSRPCDAVKVVVSAPACNAPCTAPAAPPSLCISWIAGTLPQMFATPCAAHSSASSAIGEAGVIGKIAHTSLTR